MQNEKKEKEEITIRPWSRFAQDQKAIPSLLSILNNPALEILGLQIPVSQQSLLTYLEQGKIWVIEKGGVSESVIGTVICQMLDYKNEFGLFNLALNNQEGKSPETIKAVVEKLKEYAFGGIGLTKISIISIDETIKTALEDNGFSKEAILQSYIKTQKGFTDVSLFSITAGAIRKIKSLTLKEPQPPEKPPEKPQEKPLEQPPEQLTKKPLKKMTPSEAEILELVIQNPSGIKQQEIIKKTGISQGQVSFTVRTLVPKGLVENIKIGRERLVKPIAKEAPSPLVSPPPKEPEEPEKWIRKKEDAVEIPQDAIDKAEKILEENPAGIKLATITSKCSIKKDSVPLFLERVREKMPIIIKGITEDQENCIIMSEKG